MDKAFTEDSKKQVNFKIEEHGDPEIDHDSSQIKEVRTNSNPDCIIIIVRNEDKNTEIFSWSLTENSEQEAYDMGQKGFEILWDQEGRPYIVSQNSVAFT